MRDLTPTAGTDGRTGGGVLALLSGALAVFSMPAVGAGSGPVAAGLAVLGVALLVAGTVWLGTRGTGRPM